MTTWKRNARNFAASASKRLRYSEMFSENGEKNTEKRHLLIVREREKAPARVSLQVPLQQSEYPIQKNVLNCIRAS